MKIILTKDVKGHGKKGDIIEVKDGFGKNYLIKNNLGIIADASGMKKLNTQKEKEQKEIKIKREEALKTKEKLEKETLTFKVKTGVSDRVFGSISSKQIAKELEKYQIDKKKVMLETPLTSLGIYKVKIELYKDIIGEIKVELQKESR